VLHAEVAATGDGRIPRMGGTRMRDVSGQTSTTGGFTLAEVAVAMMIMTIAVVGLLTAYPVAFGGIDTGKQRSTAAYLAEQRLEMAKATALTSWTGLPAGATTEAYGTIANAPAFQRVTTVTDNPGGNADTKLVRVDVAFRTSLATGSRTTGLTLVTIVTRRGTP
jgi:Tfp pilus assembly protein PilV